MYSQLRSLLFRLDAERSHDLTIKALALASRQDWLCSLLRRVNSPGITDIPVSLMGLDFPNRVGLAAGLDKHAQCINAFSALGFGFIETGTVTPLPQPGNDRPRLFRLPEKKAIINRMGFNSVGLEQFMENFSRHSTGSVVGINLGKNAATPLDHASNDYLAGMRRAYKDADYLAINLSSPNTRRLRELQLGEGFEQLVKILKHEQARLADEHGKHTPLAIKIAPDLQVGEIEDIAGCCVRHGIEAIIATNTTTSRELIRTHPLASENGGLSGAPLKALSTRTIDILARSLQGEIPIIGAGGILGADDAAEKFQAGASLVQIYTGLIYQGPGLVTRLRQAIAMAMDMN